MIDWLALLINALWLAGLALLLAVLSHAFYRSLASPLSFSATLTRPHTAGLAWTGGMLFALGLAAASLASPWQVILWSALALVCGVQVVINRRRQAGLSAGLMAAARSWLQSQQALVTGIIALGLILASLYALIILPWMQPDEPRHFEVALHIARLGKPTVTSADRVSAWEQELIGSMEDLSFWWYGFSLIGWDPAKLPSSFAEIWGPAYSTAFFQPPLYYSVSGGLVSLWGDELPIAQAVLRLRLLGLILLALSLWGVYRAIRELIPNRPHWAVGVLCLAALWPSHLAANAAVNNDLLAETLVVWTLYFAINLLRRGPSLSNISWLLALTIFGLTTKRTALTSTLLGPAAFLLWSLGEVWNRRLRHRGWVLAGALALTFATLVFFGFILARAGRLGLPATFWADLASGVYWRNLAAFPWDQQADALLRTFVGWFGWMRVPLFEPFYWLGGLLVLLAVLGLVRQWLHARQQIASWQKRALILLGLALVSQIAFVIGKQVLYADWAGDSISQMRYLYPVAPAVFFLFLAGLSAWIPRGWRRYALPVGVGLLLTFNLYILGFVLYPFFWL